MKARKNVGYVLGGAAFVFMMAVGFTAPSIPQASPSAPQGAANVTSSSGQTVASAPAATKSTQTASADPCASTTVDTFQKITDTYTTIYQEGKNALGTTQYADANAGLNAFADPNSAANKFSAWHQTFLAKQMSLGDLSINAYKAASDCYFNANIVEPDALANWRDDANAMLSDVGAWGMDAVDWQIQATPTDQLNQDEAKISSDLAAVQQDISALQ